ncbi:MAG: hypothetical protein HY515_04815 [Candidatus Aenigmarchaeota archaeon]|nr:hypothetical protein [Candidatus Aenigmarchaeota archaeon]
MKVNLTQLKKFAIEDPQLPYVFRQMIIEEPDYMDAEEFCIKVKVWLQLLRIARERR